MRKIAIIVLLLLMTLRASAGDFIINDGKLVWQGIFETDLGIDSLTKILSDSGQFEDVVNSEDRITFRCSRAHLDPRDYGYSIGSTPIYVSANDVSFFCTIQVKDGKYRATAEQFILTNNVSGGLLQEGDTERIETYAVDKGERLKAAFLKRPAELYDKLLTKLLTIQDKSYLNDEW